MAREAGERSGLPVRTLRGLARQLALKPMQGAPVAQGASFFDGPGAGLGLAKACNAKGLSLTAGELRALIGLTDDFRQAGQPRREPSGWTAFNPMYRLELRTALAALVIEEDRATLKRIGSLSPCAI